MAKVGENKQLVVFFAQLKIICFEKKNVRDLKQNFACRFEGKSIQSQFLGILINNLRETEQRVSEQNKCYDLRTASVTVSVEPTCETSDLISFK